MRASLLALVAIVTATATASFSYPDTAALLRRQAPGTPQYDCHANCGGVITISRTENYCQNSTFTTELEACLECALEYNIWQYYGESVSAAAQRCGLDATPLAASNATTNGTATATTASSPIGSTTSGAGGATTTAATTSGSGSSSTGAASATVSSSGSAGAASGTSSAAATASSFPGAGNQLVISSALAMVPVGAILIGWL